MASILFACSSFFLLVLSGSVHALPSHFVKGDVALFRQVISLTGPIRDQLDIGYRVLAFVSVAWCVWSWRTERRTAVIAASVFAAFALFCALFIVI
jgi:phosphoglycerol transferase MdoB-like AlkP superfamily enzyme